MHAFSAGFALGFTAAVAVYLYRRRIENELREQIQRLKEAEKWRSTKP